MSNLNTSSLSTRQQEFLCNLARGRTYEQIAEKMGISIHTVRNHVRRMYQKLNVRSSAQAVASNGMPKPGSPVTAIF
jgi:DNA-binding CsgD family transcriptional regulator